MSITYCHECGQNIDTDYNAEHFITCSICGKEVCADCGYTIEGEKPGFLCEKCYAKIMSYMDEDTV